MATRKTKIGKPKKAFTAIIKECELAMNFFYGTDTQDDGKGNLIRFHLWMSGDWKIEYKGKEYIIPVDENIAAFIDWVNERDGRQ